LRYRLSAPNRPEQRRDKIYALALDERNQVLEDGVCLLRVVGVFMTIAAQQAPVSSKACLRCFGSEASSGWRAT
jgi:hypothetical protein